MKKYHLIAILNITLLCILFCTSGCSTTQVSNPVFEKPMADPSIVIYDGRLYMYATQDPWGGETLACFSTNDFKTWQQHELNWPTKSACKSTTGNDNMVWAPSVVQAPNGKFYMYVSIGSEVWCGAADRPAGPWANVFDSQQPLIRHDKVSPVHNIDAEAFIDEDGTAYLYWGSGWNWINGHCMAVKLNEDMHTFATKPKDITPVNYFEAPFMIKHKDLYYLTYSDGKCTNDTYKVRYSVGKTPFGPFKKEADNSPILQSDHDREILGTGHHAIFKLNDKYYIAYHRHKRPFSSGTLLRQICFDRLEFDNDDQIKKVNPTDTGVQLAPIKKCSTKEVQAACEADQHPRKQTPAFQRIQRRQHLAVGHQ